MALLSESTKAEALGSPPTTAPSAWQAWRYRLKVALREPTTLIGVLTALLFTYLIVVPIISIILDAVRVQFGHERRLGKDVGDHHPCTRLADGLGEGVTEAASTTGNEHATAFKHGVEWAHHWVLSMALGK